MVGRTVQYVVIPALGVVAAWLTMRWASRREFLFGKIADLRTGRILALLMAISFVVMGGLLWARYATWHSFVFDLGSYDQKVWFISGQAGWWDMLQQTWKGGVEISPCGIQRRWGICHFQPAYLLFGLLYKVWPSPVAVLLIQVLIVVSGALPVFLLARHYLGTSVAGVLAAAIYLVYPAVQFNGMVDFRPDHVAIPGMLWAFFLLQRGQELPALAVTASLGLVKETLILSFAFFGLYMVVEGKRRGVGLAAVCLGLVMFSVVIFRVLKFGETSEGYFIIGRYFPDLSKPLFTGATPSIVGNPLSFIRHLTQPFKLTYLGALFGPLLFLPLLSPRALIPAIPSLGISLLSVDTTHASIQSQYSSAVIGPIFVALFESLRWLERRFGRQAAPLPILAGLVVLSASASLALGPTPLSIKFWIRSVSGHWHYTQYLPDRQEVLNEAAKLIPSDPRAVVVTQNDLNSARLAHRNSYYPFPVAVDRADYIFLDTRRMPFVYWWVDPEAYRRTLTALLRDPASEVIFNQDGVLVVRRRTARPSVGPPRVAGTISPTGPPERP